MMQYGILVSDLHDWKIWIGQQSYEVYEGMILEIKINDRYFKACLGKDQYEWFIIFEEDITFNLRTFEVYKVRVETIELMPIPDTPF